MRVILALIFLIASLNAYSANQSVCFGTTDKGRLENGWQLPSSGENFEAYSQLGTMMGRNYVHSAIHEILVESYANLSKSFPEKRFVYGETGWKNGGTFQPHKGTSKN
jgi:penicillin-insensitive murein DD-endopeptidase